MIILPSIRDTIAMRKVENRLEVEVQVEAKDSNIPLFMENGSK